MTEWLHFHFSLSCIGEGNGNPLQCSCLENPRDGGAWWAAVYGVAQSRTRLRQQQQQQQQQHLWLWVSAPTEFSPFIAPPVWAVPGPSASCDTLWTPPYLCHSERTSAWLPVSLWQKNLTFPHFYHEEFFPCLPVSPSLVINLWQFPAVGSTNYSLSAVLFTWELLCRTR